MLQCIFSVKDTGIGIEKAKQTLIFENFSQADPAIARQFGGTGLGLAISSMLVNMMGGTISLVSEIGKGSEFSFAVTFEVAKEAVQKEDSDILPLDRQKSVRILVVEDNDLNQVLIKSLLEKLGHSVLIAKTAKEAITMIDETPFDLVFMDIYLPDMNGYEATRLIKARQSDALNASVPIIALTANVSDEDKQSCLDAGMDDYISKPIKLSQLVAILQKFIS